MTSIFILEVTAIMNKAFHKWLFYWIVYKKININNSNEKC